MASKFSIGTTVYAKDGRSFVVEAIDGRTVYCISDNGVETEFPETTLLTESEWAARSDGRRDISQTRMKQARAYHTAADRIDPTAAEHLLAKAERLSPSLLDFTAYVVARRVLAENHDDEMGDNLSIIKCRDIFDQSKPEIRASLLAGVLGTRADMLLSALKLGDNLMRAMLDKGLEPHSAAFEDFQDRPRR